MALLKGKIIEAKPTRLDAAKVLLDRMIDDSREIMTIFYGEGYDQDELDNIIAYTKKLNPDLEVETIHGKQDIYTYIFAVE